MPEKLDAGSTLPTLQLDLVSGKKTTLPDEIETDYAVLLFYRGHW